METSIKLKAGSVLFLSAESERKTLNVGLIVLTGEELNKYPVGRFVVDLSSIRYHKETLPLDYNHEPEEILGSVGGFRMTENGLEAFGNLFSTSDGDRADEIILRLQNGTPYEVSPLLVTENADLIELADGEETQVNGRTFCGPMTIFRNAELRGVAICPYGTDKNTNVKILKLSEETKMTEEEKKELEYSEETASDYGAVPELENYIAEFGLEKGVEYYRKGVSFDEAKESDYQELKKLRLSEEEKKEEESSQEPPQEESQDPEKKEEPLKLKLLEKKIDQLQKAIGMLQLTLKNSEGSPVSGRTEIGGKPADNILVRMMQRNETKLRD